MAPEFGGCLSGEARGYKTSNNPGECPSPAKVIQERQRIPERQTMEVATVVAMQGLYALWARWKTEAHDAKDDEALLPTLSADAVDSICASVEEFSSEFAHPTAVVDRPGLSRRRNFNGRRWRCISRPQYKYSCGLSSLVSIWNYLYTTNGCGNLKPITQEEALTILGFSPPFENIRFGPFTGNKTLMKWFRKLNSHFKVHGQASYFWKAHGIGRTMGVSADKAFEDLQETISSRDVGYIYHCHNHYFVPCGIEIVPYSEQDSYNVDAREADLEPWLLIGEPSRKKQTITCVKWDWVKTDIECQNPYHFNIRQPDKGVYKRKVKKTGGNLHCLMQFRKLDRSPDDAIIFDNALETRRAKSRELLENDDVDNEDMDDDDDEDDD